MVRALARTLGVNMAKLRPPRAQRPLVPRPRLLEATRGRPLVGMVADGGYGKSSFLAEWAAESPDIVWYSLDERDRDPTTFGQHLLVAAGYPEDEVSVWRARGADAAEDLVDRLLRKLESRPGPISLVLDDYHLVAGQAVIDATVNRLLNDRSPDLRVGLASRTPLQLRLARLRAHGLVADLAAAHLRFTPSEVVVALGHLDGLAPEQARALHDLTDGWPAAVQLLGDAWADAHPRSYEALPGPASWSGSRGFDTFVEEEILPQLSPNDVDVLSRLCVLPEIQERSCAAVLHDANIFARIQQLAAHFSFITCVADESPQGATYRIHQLVRGYLARRLSPTERRQALECAADALSELDQPIEAGWLAVELDDATRLAELIKREARRLLAQGRSRTVTEWFEHLPSALVEADPQLLARHAQLLGEQGEIESATRQFERAVSAHLAADHSAAACDALRVMAGIFEQRGDYAQAREALSRAAALLSDEADQTLAVALWSQIATLRLHDGDAEGAETLAREVVERTEANDQPQMLAIAHHNLAHILDMRGRHQAAVSAYRRALDLKQQLGLEASRALSLNGLGVTYYRQGLLDVAEDTLQAAEHLARACGMPLIASYARSNLGDVLRDRGQLQRALDVYREALIQKEALGSTYALAYTWNSLAELYRRMGDLDQARAFNARALALRVEEAGPIERQLYRAEAGRIALAAGDYPTALGELLPATWELQRLGCEHFAFQSAWSLGTARWRLDRTLDPLLLELLDASQTRADPLPLLALVPESPDLAVALWVDGVRSAPLADTLPRHPEPVQREIGRALTDAPHAAADLLGLLARLPGYPPIAAVAELEHSDDRAVAVAASAVLDTLRAGPAPPLDVRGFGALRVLRRGEPLPERAWRRQRSVELFALLLLAGPEGRTRDELIVECWPDASPDAGVAQFHAHLHALRSALEPEAARGTSRYVLAEGRIYRLAFDAIQSWDVGTFEERVAQARTLDAQGDATGAEHALIDADELYRGPLFDGLHPDGEWLEAARERLRHLAIDARVRLAQVREAAGDPTAAEQAWNGVLSLDPVREDAHRGLMRLLLSLGRRDAALDAFRRCADALDRELGVKPGPETMALYRRILAS
jgi:LuxR family maltose regulon positive regulatory protein